jgi:hypothetical protein
LKRGRPTKRLSRVGVDLPDGWTRVKWGLYEHNEYDPVATRLACFQTSYSDIDWKEIIEKYSLMKWTRDEVGLDTHAEIVEGMRLRPWADVMKHLRDKIARPAFRKYS